MMIVAHLWRQAAHFPVALASVVGLLVLVQAMYVVQAVAVAGAMSAVIGGRADHVWSALGTVVGIAVLRLGLSLGQAVAAAHLGGKVRAAIRNRAVTRALSAARLHDTSTRDGSLRATLIDGIDGTDAYVAKYIPAVVQVFVTCPVLVVLLWWLTPWAGLAVGTGVVVALVGPLAWKRMMARRGLEHWDSYEGLSADLLESLRAMGTLRVLGDVPGTRRRLCERSEALRCATQRVMRVSLAETGVTDFAVQAGTVVASAAAILHAVAGQAPAMDVYLVLLLSSEAVRPVRELSRQWHAGFLGVSAVPELSRLGAFSSGDGARTGSDVVVGDAVSGTLPAVTQDADTAPTRIEPGPGHRLEIRDLCYRYPDATDRVLDGVGFTARQGALSAVVGPSGAGKSTLFDLLLGFLTPGAGCVELDGRALLPADVALVPQRPVLFADTIRANLSMTATHTDADLVRACRAAGIWEEIAALPEALDAPVTEAGSSLSGGQRQRLALARALLAQRPVLLVDEPTSALDAHREKAVVQTLHRVARDRVVVMISHRRETLEGVDNVLTLGGTPVAGGRP